MWGSRLRESVETSAANAVASVGRLTAIALAALLVALIAVVITLKRA